MAFGNQGAILSQQMVNFGGAIIDSKYFGMGSMSFKTNPAASASPGWVCVYRANFTLTAAKTTGATVITIAANGTANGDRVGVALDDGTIHWTTISSGGGTTSITLAAGLPSAANSGNEVYFLRWKAMANLAA